MFLFSISYTGSIPKEKHPGPRLAFELVSWPCNSNGLVRFEVLLVILRRLRQAWAEYVHVVGGMAVGPPPHLLHPLSHPLDLLAAVAASCSVLEADIPWRSENNVRLELLLSHGQADLSCRLMMLPFSSNILLSFALTCSLTLFPKRLQKQKLLLFL